MPIADDLNFTTLVANIYGLGSSEAAELCHELIKDYPDQCEGYFLLGLLAYKEKRKGDSLKMMEAAVKVNPDSREATLALSCLYAEAERLTDALYFSKLGVSLEANLSLSSIVPIELKNFIFALDQTVSHFHYVNALYAFDAHNFKAAIEECLLDLDMYEGYSPAKVVLAKSYMELKHYGAAAGILKELVDQDAAISPDIVLYLAEALFQLGLFENALQHIDMALSQEGASLAHKAAAVKVLSLMPNAEDRLAKLIAELNREDLKDTTPYFENEPSNDEKVRIGVLSDKFYDCAEGRMIQHFMTRMDPKVFVPLAYMQNTNNDALTDEFVNELTVARKVYDINDKTLALIMQRDGVDILMEMCGVGENQRLSLLVRRPAPHCISWLAEPTILNQPGIDFIFCNGDGPPSDPTCFELEHGRLAKFANESCLEVSSLPALKNGYLTYGCHFDLAGLACGDGALFSAILKAHPEAKLNIRTRHELSAVELQLLNNHFAKDDLGDRITLSIADDKEALGGYFENVDVYLTTAYANSDDVFQSLYMGVPAVVRRRTHLVNPAYLDVIASGGQGYWVCATDEDVFSTVSQLVGDLDGLSLLRQGLRDQVKSSKLMDANAVTLHLMHALLKIQGLNKFIEGEG